MGVLDDAIREHLELKRRHGATDDEIARKEAEALGPARRGPAAEPFDAAAEPLAAADPPDGEPLAASEVADSVPADVDREPPETAPTRISDTPSSMADAAAALGESPAAETEVPVAETEPVPAGEEVTAEPVEPTIDVPAEVEPPAAIDPPGEPIHDVDRDPLEPPPPMPAAPGADSTPSSGATQEFDTLSHRGDDEPAPAGDDDVLEETPEFLRETPEHDRLWFEQKPPRDFDLED